MHWVADLSAPGWLEPAALEAPGQGIFQPVQLMGVVVLLGALLVEASAATPRAMHQAGLVAEEMESADLVAVVAAALQVAAVGTLRAVGQAFSRESWLPRAP